jgi:predicted dehydrogenase
MTLRQSTAAKPAGEARSETNTGKQVKRYAIVGTGGRIMMFAGPMCEKYTADAALVGMCDVNPGRLKYYQQRFIDDYGYAAVPTYPVADFERMIAETHPDTVIVCTVDAFHHEYIIRAMNAGCDVITEKPMTIDAEKCRAIFEVVQRTGKKLRVTFNYRWGPGPTELRKAIASGVIGEVIHADMEYMLDTSHGADYFRRWHREKEKSGGLMVHKSTHHFDLVNWWIDAVPQTVFGMGRLAFYGRSNAESRGVTVKYSRYTGADYGDDPFALDMSKNENLKKLYLDNEKYDGYIRDRNVFGEDMDIEDSMSVMVRYNSGVVLNYSLNSYLPCEGFNISINGTKGRIEYSEPHGSHIIAGQDDKEMAQVTQWKPTLLVRPQFKSPYEIPIISASGGHGGGDPLLQQQIFDSHPPEEHYGRNAGYQQGAASILIGIAANQSFKTGLPVQINDLCPQLPLDKPLHELV